MVSIEDRVRVLEPKSTPASRASVSDPVPPSMFRTAVAPSPLEEIVIVSDDPFVSITKPAPSDVIPSIVM